MLQKSKYLTVLLSTLILGHMSIFSLSAEASSFSIFGDKNCGFLGGRPFALARLKWSGFSSTTRGTASSAFYYRPPSGSTFRIVASASDPKRGANSTSTADAGVSNLKGSFYGITTYDASFFVNNPKRANTATFVCS